MEVIGASAAVGEAAEGDRPENRPERAGVAGLDRAMPVAVDVDHLVNAFLARRTQVEVVLEELTDKLAGVHAQARLELAMG